MRLQPRSLSLLLVLSMPLVAGNAQAFSYVASSDNRSIYAETFIWYDSSAGSDSYTVSDSKSPLVPLANFSKTVSITETFGGNSGTYSATGTATQDSVLGADGLSASGTVTGTQDSFIGDGGDPNDVGSYWWEEGEIYGRGGSVFDISFTVGSNTLVDLDASITGDGASAHVVFTNQTTENTIFDTEFLSGAAWVEQILLTPGTYSLFAEAHVAADIDGGGDAGYSVSLTTVPESGDFNRDSAVEQGDLSLLLSDWGATVQPVDWTSNWDGFVDQNELSDLLSNWGTGVGAVAAVPEPSAVALLGIGLLGIYAMRRRRN